jgi:hypothetical protein
MVIFWGCISILENPFSDKRVIHLDDEFCRVKFKEK